jgi:uncharacterized protein (TIGR03083 family)
MPLSFSPPREVFLPITRDRLLTTARHERDALGRTVQYMPPDRWGEESAPWEGWNAKDVLAHLAASEVVAASLLAGEEATELTEHRKSLEDRPFDVDAWNNWTIDRRREASAVSLAKEWGQAADLLLPRAAQVSDQDWAEREIPWVGGDIRLKYLVQLRVAEWWIHGEDIRQAGRLPPRREHWPIHTVNDLAIRLIPYALSRAGHSFADASVQIDLAGVGEGTWHQDVSPGDLPSGKKPDAVINGEGYAFASVAGGRADADFCLYEGLLNVGGDVELAEAVLRTLRAAP